MSNFHSNYKDIHKQIATADFTDEQIQELMTALQTKRSAKSKLTKEEKVFYQCCRERRSYANNQDLDTVVCPMWCCQGYQKRNKKRQAEVLLQELQKDIW